jgi:hypothetical protein
MLTKIAWGLVVIWLVFSLFIRPLPPANNILAAVFVAAAA